MEICEPQHPVFCVWKLNFIQKNILILMRGNCIRYVFKIPSFVKPWNLLTLRCLQSFARKSTANQECLNLTHYAIRNLTLCSGGKSPGKPPCNISWEFMLWNLPWSWAIWKQAIWYLSIFGVIKMNLIHIEFILSL